MYLLFLCFQTADVKMLVTACRFVPMFSSIGSPTKLCPDLVSFACLIVTEFWSLDVQPLLHVNQPNEIVVKILVLR